MTPRPVSADDQAREQIRNALDESLLVEASAGTGKTSELVRRIVNVLRRGLTTIDRIVAVTFTNKAAGELKLRLRQELDRARSQSSDTIEAGHMEHALAHLEEASIGTIHAFCAQILRERPVEARVDPDFEELDDPAAKRLYGRVFRRWFQDKLNADSPGLRRALARLATERDYEDRTPMEAIEYAGWQIVEWRDFPHPWQYPDITREETIDALAAYVAQFVPQLNRHKPDLIEPVKDLLPWMERQPRDYDMLEGFLFRLWRIWNRFHSKNPPDPKLFEAIGHFRPVADADLAARLRDELWELVGLYDDAKRRAGQLDFVDLLLLVRNLLKNDEGVRTYLQQRYSHLFVDEFQDTDPLQAEIILLLASDEPTQSEMLKVTPVRGKLFLVGDPKQSIYKFRRADVQLYQMLRTVLAGKGVRTVTLSRSFRSVPGVQNCVNAAFAEVMNGDPESAQANYVALEQDRKAILGQPSIVALPAPFPYGTYRISNERIEACLPKTITGYVEWLIRESGWQVWDPESESLTPIAPRHICILFRRFTNWRNDLTRDYARSLEDRGIPHLLVGSKTFHWREEIESMRAALTAIEWPEDELAVYATLRGALFAIPDHALLHFRHKHGKLYPFREPLVDASEEESSIMEALAILAELNRNRNERPIAETVYRILEASRIWAAFAFRPAGNQVLANVRRVVDMARQFETSGGFSFRGFVEELNIQAEKSESAEAPVMEEGADGVRIMTTHAAKGLEFPVVILADMTAGLAHKNPDKYLHAASGLCAMRLIGWAPLELHQNGPLELRRDEAEGVRVAYVAATRARDLLVVPVVGDAERDGWLSPLNKAVYPHSNDSRSPAISVGCPEFGEVSVWMRPASYPQEISVKPGLHTSRVGEVPVTWWDPSILAPGKEEHFSQRQKEIFAENGEWAEAGIEEHAQWREAREATLESGQRPSLQLMVASEAVEAPAEIEWTIGVERTARDSRRPQGKRFGALVHNTLRDIPLQASREQVMSVAKLQARLLASEDQELEAAVFAVIQALNHPLMDRARKADRMHREYPVVFHGEDDRVVEGVADLVFVEGDSWILVDFKTDAEFDGLAERYRAQLGWYAAALRRITGQAVQCYLLAV